ncbi:DUF2059 domain-containing protein [Roseisolibacter agri]|uniref:DUF2059 domain-containing protein n=1 Tax=Roseisolibacter agri TaxID=2014610 RepID=A0AA37VEX3_9BACT|nr:DUF2059 domain-containing protein [Roseisolibacter agri]GLC25934.1 hypothetical protein rosag_24470 [Roseisolibacter agri]
MRPTRLLTLVALTLAVAATPIAAQQPAPDAAHRAAVQRLLQVTRVREMTEGNIETMLAAQLRQMPQLAPYAGVLRDFYREQMDWKVLEPEFMRVYLEVFTEPEVRELIVFYETPLGQKMLTKLPALMAKSNELSTRRLQAAMPQLMERMQAAMQGGVVPGTPPKPDSTRPPTS